MTKRVRGILMLLAAGACVLAAYLLAKANATGANNSVVLIAAPAMAAAGLLGYAFRNLTWGPGSTESDFRHTVPIFGVTVLLLGGAGFGLGLLAPADFGQLGHYRAGALVDATKKTPRHRMEKACVPCHEEKAQKHDKDAHARVACELCHGPGGEHVDFRKANPDLPKTDPGPDSAKMQKRTGRAWCLRCHQLDLARPGGFGQIRWEEHMKLTWVADPATECSECHDPHEPLLMDRDLRSARLHPAIQECRTCHPGGKAAEKLPEKHPPQFECAYCHKPVVEKFAWSPHKNVACTTCHPYFSETSAAGRIIRDTDPRFCLLCHRRAKYRVKAGDGVPKGISWPKHRDSMARTMDEGEGGNRTLCTDCHREATHWPTEDFWEVDEDEDEDEEDEDE